MPYTCTLYSGAQFSTQYNAVQWCIAVAARILHCRASNSMPAGADSCKKCPENVYGRTQFRAQPGERVEILLNIVRVCCKESANFFSFNRTKAMSWNWDAVALFLSAGKRVQKKRRLWASSLMVLTEHSFSNSSKNFTSFQIQLLHSKTAISWQYWGDFALVLCLVCYWYITVSLCKWVDLVCAIHCINVGQWWNSFGI